MNTTTDFAVVPLDKIFLETAYGREPNRRFVQRLIREWDPLLVGALLLSDRRNGTYACVDGWHRVIAGREVGGVTALPARLYTGLSIEQEARIFDLHDREKNKRRPVESFKARLQWGDPVAEDIQRMVGRYGLKVATSSHGEYGGIRAVQTLDTIYRLGPDRLAQTVALLAETYFSDYKAYSAEMLLGADLFIHRYSGDPKLDRHKLVVRLRRAGHTGVLGEARRLQWALKKPMSGLVGAAIVAVYNHGLRMEYRLPEWAI